MQLNLLLFNAPQYWILHFLWGNQHQTFISDIIRKLPEMISLQDIYSQVRFEQKYELVGFIVNQDFHYFTLFYSQGIWKKFDDINVTKVFGSPTDYAA